MKHCCQFKAQEVYYLMDTPLCSNRKLSIGFCPVCEKPISELYELRFDGKENRFTLAGVKANEFVLSHKSEILYSFSDCNLRKLKMKPYGWKYGVNKSVKVNGKIRVKQIACDFYGNKETIKIV